MFQEEEIPLELRSINFFALQTDIRYLNGKELVPDLKKNRLPDTSVLCDEFSFAQIAMGWHEEGLGFQIEVNQPYQRSSSTQIENGDSIELLIDTRDVKTSGFNTRFCHHFYFLPKNDEGLLCGEITHFRTEDRHPHCDPSLLVLKSEFSSRSYKCKIFIPSECLHGYDPNQFTRLGFTYRINRVGGGPQHFSVVGDEYQLTQQPSLWSSLRLIR